MLQVVPATLSPSPHSLGSLVCLLPVSRVLPGTLCPSLGPSQPKMGLGGCRSIRPWWQVTLEKVLLLLLLLLRVRVPWAQQGIGASAVPEPRGPPSTWVWVSLQCLSRVGGRWGCVGPARWWQWPERPHSCPLRCPRRGWPQWAPVTAPRGGAALPVRGSAGKGLALKCLHFARACCCFLGVPRGSCHHPVSARPCCGTASFSPRDFGKWAGKCCPGGHVWGG